MSEELTLTEMEELADTPVYKLTDAGNAERFRDLHADRIRFVRKWAAWLVWDNGRWHDDYRDVAVTELAIDVSVSMFQQLADSTAKLSNDDRTALSKWAARSASRTQITSMVFLARGKPGIAIEHDQLDADPNALGVANGWIDLTTGEHHLPDPDKLMTMHSPVDYDPDAEAPRWHQALQEWLPVPDVRAYVQALVGEAVNGVTRDHILVVHYGAGGNGKSTFVQVLRFIFGPYFVEPHKSLLVQSRYEEHPTAMADLFRVRLAVAAESEKRQKLSEALVKNLTGGDSVRARRMREDFWSFDPTHSLWLQTNYLPEIAGRDEGIWRRLKVVPWTNKFTGTDRDPKLLEILKAEAPGILNWIIEGSLAWHQHGLQTPDVVDRATLDYRNREDVLTRFATDVGIEFNIPGTEMAIAALNILLWEWCEDEGLQTPAAKDIAEWLKTNGCSRHRKQVDGSKKVLYRGVTQNTKTPGPATETSTSGHPGHAPPVKSLGKPYIETNRDTVSTVSSGTETAPDTDSFAGLCTTCGTNQERYDTHECKPCFYANNQT